MIQIQKSMREAKQAMLAPLWRRLLPGWRAVFAEQRLSASHAGGDCSARRHVQSDYYLYYKNKDDLFLHVVEDLVETAITETVQAAEAPGTSLEKLARMVRGKMAFYEREREFSHLLKREAWARFQREAWARSGPQRSPQTPFAGHVPARSREAGRRVTRGHGRRGAAAYGGQTAHFSCKR